jgi:hypothetical protein
MMAAHVAPTYEKGPGGWPGEEGDEDAARDEDPVAGRSSSIGPIRTHAAEPPSCDREGFGYDETRRTRLIADIMVLIRETSMPQSARLAGMTLVGWLARRRPDEPPHAIGVEEARESEGRIKAARARTR